MKPIKVILFFIFGLCAQTAFLHAEPAGSNDISVKAAVDHAFITIGDPVEYTVTIEHKPNIQILSAIPSPDKDIFKVKKVIPFEEKDKDSVLVGKTFHLTTYVLGEFVLEPVQIQYRIDGGPVEMIETEKIYVRVKSVAEGEPKSDIRGVKGTVEIPRDLRPVVYSTSGIVFIILLLLLLRYFKKQREAVRETKPALSAEEEAFFRLNKLFDSNLIKEQKYKEYYFIFSEILRVYFERRYEIQAVESTTFEIIGDLKAKGISQSMREKINEVLEAADLAKFAKWQPEPQKVIYYNQQAKELIEAARLKKVALTNEEGADGV